jgi:pimeloyl-ACP methyl ester carboxylesterase
VSRKVVFFLRGLSTSGSDSIRFSRLDLGPFHSAFEREFRNCDFEFVPVLGMEVGTLREVADRALRVIEEHDVWKSRGCEVGLFGHSTGGLIARMVAHLLPEKKRARVTRCLSVATPNHGSELARLVCEMPDKYPSSFRFLHRIGYDAKKDHPYFAQLLKENVETVFSELSHLTPKLKTEFASVICWAPRADWCLPLRMAANLPLWKNFVMESDGFVERSTQHHGRVLAEVQIDHLREVGLFDDGEKFKKLCEVIREYFEVRRSFL